MLKHKFAALEQGGQLLEDRLAVKDRENDLESFELFYGLRLAKSQKKFTQY